MLDVGLFQDPLFHVAGQAWLVEWFPGFHGMRVLMDFGLTAELDSAGHLGWAMVYLGVLGLVTISAFYRETRLR